MQVRANYKNKVPPLSRRCTALLNTATTDGVSWVTMPT